MAGILHIRRTTLKNQSYLISRACLLLESVSQVSYLCYDMLSGVFLDVHECLSEETHFYSMLPYILPYFRFRIILVFYYLYIVVCVAPTNIGLFCLSYTVPSFPLPIFHRFHLPILTPCFSLFTLALVFALPSLASLYCPMSALQSLTFHHSPLFGPPFTDLSSMPHVWPSNHWPLYTAISVSFLFLTWIHYNAFPFRIILTSVVSSDFTILTQHRILRRKTLQIKVIVIHKAFSTSNTCTV